MQAKKISLRCSFIVVALALILAGCTPAGPRAFFDGKNYLDQGDYANAAARFKIAATLLATNAAVWNYYGMALQADHQPQAAAAAYQRAVDLDRDLVEAHFNLGGLWLEQNQPDAARTEFTAYTLRRSNDPAGWLRLGSAQLRLGETVAAEKSFSKVLYLRPADPAAYNGLGLTRIQRGMPRDAVRFFAAAVRSDPGFAPAMLNLATVNHQYLHDDKTALANLRAYLALTPPPADWDQANALANQLEHAELVPPSPLAAAATPVEPQVPPVIEAARAPRHESESRARSPQKNVELAPAPASAPSLPPLPVQVEQVPAPPEIVASPRATANLSSASAHASPNADQYPVDQQAPAAPSQKPGLWQRLFASSAQPASRNRPILKRESPPCLTFLMARTAPCLPRRDLPRCRSRISRVTNPFPRADPLLASISMVLLLPLLSPGPKSTSRRKNGRMPCSILRRPPKRIPRGFWRNTIRPSWPSTSEFIRSPWRPMNMHWSSSQIPPTPVTILRSHCARPAIFPTR